MASIPILGEIPADLTVLLVSVLVCFLIKLTAQWHGKYSIDTLEGVQRFHETATPRIGGLAIIFALGVGVLVLHDEPKQLLRTLFILGFFVFSFGFTEDITKQVSVAIRLWAGFMPALIGYFMSGVVLRSVGWEPVDALLQFNPVAIIFTAFAMGGVTHAINIIDGFNGLCTWASIWALTAIMCVAIQVGDTSLAMMLPIMIAGIAGFLLFNWPFGKLFLGDGGSYLLGLCVGWCSVLLAVRNPTVFPFTLLLVCVYPVTEVLYSMYRRNKSGKATGQPDRMHLHQLVAMVYIYPGFNQITSSSVLKNSLTGFVMSLLMIPTACIAVLFYDRPPIILLAIALFAAIYVVFYRNLLAKFHAIVAARKTREASGQSPSGR